MQKHGVSFNEAASVLGDTLSVTVSDPDHSLDEDRYIAVGLSYHSRLLIVAHTNRGNNVRIISARELTRREKKAFEDGKF